MNSILVRRYNKGGLVEMRAEFYEKKIIKLIQESFTTNSHEFYKESLNKKIYGIFVEDLLLLIDAVLEEDGASFKINLDFIMSEFLMDGNRYSATQILRRVIKALRYLKGMV